MLKKSIPFVVNNIGVLGSIKPIFLHSTNKFAMDWQNSNQQIILKQLKQQTIKNPSFLKQNSTAFVHHLLDLMEMKNYKAVLKIAKQIQYGRLGDWKYLVRIGAGIHTMLNSKHLKTQSDQNKKIIFQIMAKFRFEPNIQNNQSLYNYIKQELSLQTLSQTTKSKNVFIYAPFFIVSWPELFQNHKVTIQEHLLSRVGSFDLYDSYTLIQGFVSEFWDGQFRAQLKNHQQKNKLIQKYLNFSDLKIDNDFVFAENQKMLRTATEVKIGQFLKDLGYQIKQNCLINQMEVDYLLPNNFILEYNGVFHFNIALQQPKPTAYQRWKNKMFRSRNFYRCLIPFYEWQKLSHQKIQRAYLMQKIEFSVLQRNMSLKQLGQFKKYFYQNKLQV